MPIPSSRPAPASVHSAPPSAVPAPYLARSRTLIALVWLATVFLGASTWWAAWTLSERDQHDAMQRAQRDTANLARIIAEQTTRAISGADRILHVVGYDLQRLHDDDALLRDLMQSASLDSDLLFQLAHADRNGDLIQTSIDGAPARVNLSDREHFRVHKEGKVNGLFISRPVFGRASGKWSIQLSRRIDDSNGGFGGIIVASLDPFYFSRTFDDIDVGERGTISIFGRDGILRARNILTDDIIGHDVSASPVYKALREAPDGFLRSTSSVDGVTRLIGYRALTAYPLVVTAGFAEADFMAETWTRQRAYVIGASGASVLLVVLAALVTWQSRVQERAKAALDEAIRHSKANKQKLRDIAETASDWFWEMGADLRFTSVSGPVDGQAVDEAAFLGRRRDEIALRVPGDEAVWEEHQRCLDERRPFRNFEVTCVEPGGATSIWSVSGKPLFNEAGHFEGYRGSGTDITKRHQAERSLAASEQRYRAMFQAVGQPIVTTDEDGVVIGFNPSAEHLFGYRSEEVVGRNIAILLPDSSPRSSQPGLSKRCPAANRPAPDMRQRELTIRRKDATTVPVEVALSGWRSDGREYVIGILRDLTLTKQIEDNLRQARDSAEHANRMKSQFLATISHEIRTPMNGVLGTLTLLCDGHLTPEERHLATVARRSAENLLRLLDDVLDFSKLEAGRITIEEADCTPTQAIEAALEVFQPAAREKGIALSVCLSPSMPDAVVTDAARLRQILFNLVGNAVKFTEAGHVTVRAWRGEKREDGRFALCFEVEDTGIGLRPEATATLFDRFTQADNSITRRYGGTGLGLAICRELCAAMGGGIDVRSAFGRGSVFAFSVACLPAAPRKEAGKSLGTAAAALPPLPPSRVLAVDDNEVNRDIIRRLLERSGHTVRTASDGREALRAAEEADLDLVLMDVQMPDMDGLETTRRIRRLANRNSRVPVIALTAQASGSTQSECLAAGMNGFVTKPIRPPALWQAMAAALSGRTAAPDQPSAVESGPIPLIDREQIDSIATLLEADGWREALNGFAASARKQIVTLRRMLDGNDTNYRRVAHTLKGAAWNVGAKRLGSVAMEIEGTASPEDARRLVVGLDDIFAETIEALGRTASASR